MLNGRSALLINYENANRNWDKAKAHKKDEVWLINGTIGYLEWLLRLW